MTERTYTYAELTEAVTGINVITGEKWSRPFMAEQDFYECLQKTGREMGLNAGMNPVRLTSGDAALVVAIASAKDAWKAA